MHIVMVIDDNKTDLLIAERALEGTYRVLVEQDARHALEHLRSTTKKPSLILMDIEMRSWRHISSVRWTTWKSPSCRRY